MRNKLLKTVICLFATLVLFSGVIPASAEVNTRAVDNAQSIIDGIVAYKNASSIQDWIDGEITQKAGISSEWYVVGLSQYKSGYNFSNYEKALVKYLAKNGISSASSRQKYALALMAAGSTDTYIYSALNDSIGELGVMSWIYGLHLLNNGYESADYTLDEVKSKLLSLQTADGGWSVKSGNTEIDATAMAIQALAPYYSENAVKTAVDKALTFLSAQQKEGGDYSSYGVSNAESTAQVLVALSSLGIDAKADSRFIKNGNTLFDGIALYRLSNGSYCHQQGGAFSDNATVQVFYSMVSYLRMQRGQTGLYLLDNAPDYKDLKIPEAKPQPNEAVSANTSSVASQAQKPTASATQNSSAQTSSSATISDTTVSDNDVTSGENTETVSDTDLSAETQITEKDGEKQTAEKKKGISYKVWACLAIVLVSGGVCVLLYFLKIGNKSNYILVAAVSAVAIAIVLFTNFQTADNYYSGTGSKKENAIGTVTISVRCDTIPDKSAKHIPDNGIILDTTAYQIEAGDTVYDILLQAATDNKIHLDTNGENDTVYVSGLNNIYEFDFGDKSGWIYYVNGEGHSESCGQYELSPNDKIEWLYSCDLGNDLQ